MGLWSRLIRRQRGVLAEDSDEETETLHLPRPPATRGTHIPGNPPPTAGTRRPAGPQGTAGTPSYRDPGGTPSTRRIHNPSHPGGR